MAKRAGNTWVAIFDGQLGRVYAVDGDRRLRHLESEGLDARPGPEQRPDTGSLHNAQLRKVEDVAFITPQDFVTQFAGHLEERAGRGAFDHLVVSAAPKALADFRQLASDALKARVVAELNKDYVHVPIKQVEAALAEHL